MIARWERGAGLSAIGQEYWNELPFPSPGHLPNPGTEPISLVSPALAGRLFNTEPPGKPFLSRG